MSTAIVILNYNDYENTKKLVKNIKEYKILDKIVIVDNKSTNNDELKRLNTLICDKVDVIVSDKNGGYSYGNNYALKYIDKKYGEQKFEYVIISNPDVYVKEYDIEKTIEFLNNNKKCVIASPRMYYTNGPARRSAWKNRKIITDIANSTRITQAILFHFFKKGEYSKKDFKNSVLEVDSIAGSFFVANHKLFKNIGYFDENTFLFYEEDIIGVKAKEKGYSIFSLNNLSFIHYESKTIGKIMNIFKKQDILFNSRIYFQKEYNKANSFQIMIFMILRYIRKVELIFETLIKKVINS